MCTCKIISLVLYCYILVYLFLPERGGLWKCAGGPEGDVPNGLVDTAADVDPQPPVESVDGQPPPPTPGFNITILLEHYINNGPRGKYRITAVVDAQPQVESVVGHSLPHTLGFNVTILDCLRGKYRTTAVVDPQSQVESVAVSC